MNRKEFLQKELAQILAKEEKEMVESNYPIIKKKFEGKCFKTPNSYGGDSEKWFLYSKIVSITKEDVYDTRGNGITAHCKMVRFQSMPNGMIEIKSDYTGYVHSVGQPISEVEFTKAWNKLIDKINAI